MVVGIIGGNHFAIQLSAALKKYNIKIYIFCNKQEIKIKKFCDKLFIGNYKNTKQIIEFYNTVDKIILNTNKIDFEKINLKELNDKNIQNINVFILLNDRLKQKNFLDLLNINIPKYIEIENKTKYNFIKNKVPLPIVIKNRNFDDSRVNFSWLPSINSEKDDNLCKKYLSNNKNCFIEQYIDWIGQFTITAFRDFNKNNAICSYNWTIYYDNCLFITQPNYVRKKILHDSKVIVNKVLDTLNSPGVYTFKFLEKRKLKLVLNSVRPFFHISGDQTLKNFKYSQYEYYAKILASEALPINEKIMNQAMISINGNKYTKEIMNQIDLENKFTFIDYNISKTKTNISNCVCFAVLFTPRNPKNHYILKKMINLLHNFKN